MGNNPMPKHIGHKRPFLSASIASRKTGLLMLSEVVSVTMIIGFAQVANASQQPDASAAATAAVSEGTTRGYAAEAMLLGNVAAWLVMLWMAWQWSARKA